MVLADVFSARWAFSRWALVIATAYAIWLTVFQSWLEPVMRRRLSALVGVPVVWLPAGPFFRVWGVRAAPRREADAAVGLLGSLVVLGAAVLPVVLYGVGTRFLSPDPSAGALLYLVSAPMVLTFVLVVLSGAREPAQGGP